MSGAERFDSIRFDSLFVLMRYGCKDFNAVGGKTFSFRSPSNCQDFHAFTIHRYGVVRRLPVEILRRTWTAYIRVLLDKDVSQSNTETKVSLDAIAGNEGAQDEPYSFMYAGVKTWYWPKLVNYRVHACKCKSRIREDGAAQFHRMGAVRCRRGLNNLRKLW